MILEDYSRIESKVKENKLITMRQHMFHVVKELHDNGVRKNEIIAFLQQTAIDETDHLIV